MILKFIHSPNRPTMNGNTILNKAFFLTEFLIFLTIIAKSLFHQCGICFLEALANEHTLSLESIWTFENFGNL